MVVQIQIWKRARQLLLTGQPGMGIGAGMARNGAGGGHRRANTVLRIIAAAGAALLLPHIHRDRNTAIPMELQGFHFPHPYRHGQPLADTDAHLGITGTGTPRLLQYPSGALT